MDARIILAGQPVNALAALDAATQAAGRAGAVGQQGDLLSLYRDQGEGIASGNQQSLNALARLDPMASLGVQEAQQGMAIRQEQLSMARASAARAAESHAMQMSEAERARQMRVIGEGLATALPAAQAGDLDRVNQIFRTGGLPPANSIEEAMVVLAQADGVFETFQRLSQMQPQAPSIPSGAQTLQYRAEQAGLVPGTPEYQQFMLSGGSQGQQIQFTGPDGTTFSMGPGGQTQQLTGPEADLPAPITEPVRGAGSAFGLPSVFQGAVNTIADTAGADMPFPETDQAATQIQLTADALLQELSSGYDRQPPSWLMQSIRENIPQPGQLFSGPQRARNRYTAIRQDLESQLAIEERARQTTRDPRELQSISRRISALRNGVARIDRIMEGMSDATPISDDDAALIERYLD